MSSPPAEDEVEGELEDRPLEIERILQLADVLEQRVSPVRGFNMSTYVTFDDGSTTTHVDEARSLTSLATDACLAGHVIIIFRDVPVASRDIEAAAAEILGLDGNQALELFHPDRRLWSLITPEQAAVTLRFLAVTGMVLWPEVQARHE